MTFALAGRIAARQRWADPVAKKLQPLIRRAVSPPPVRNFLDGVWLGAPLHPALTDVPVGTWTAALALDVACLFGDEETLGAGADRALAMGTIAAVPAAVTGLNDLRDLVGQSRRIAMVHALLNVVGLSLSTASLVYRRNGRRGLARCLSGTGYLISATAAHLGGELSFGLGIRANRTLGQMASDFVAVLDESELDGAQLRQVSVGGVPVLLARAGDGELCALANTCTHLGGPLAEGSREGDRVVCPWHGSCFDLRTGGVVRGPAVFPQARYQTRVREGKIEVGLPDSAGAELPEVANLQPRSARS
ncbi:MAG: Rieske 2Fe-2S domain-containing protein [Gaiellaceae bacterium]